jgi:hypothetical protein
MQGFYMVRKGMHGAAQAATLVATETAKFVAKPVVHAATTTATVVTAVKKKLNDDINDWKRYVTALATAATTMRLTVCCLFAFLMHCRHQAQRQVDIAEAHSEPTFMTGGPDTFCPQNTEGMDDVTKIITDTEPLDRCGALFSTDLNAHAIVTGM